MHTDAVSQTVTVEPSARGHKKRIFHILFKFVDKFRFVAIFGQELVKVGGKRGQAPIGFNPGNGGDAFGGKQALTLDANSWETSAKLIEALPGSATRPATN